MSATGNTLLKKTASLLGFILVLFCLAFVGEQLHVNWSKIASYTFDSQDLTILALGAVGYCCICLLLSSAWQRLLSALTGSALPNVTMRTIYARSQIGKYIPGNIMHFAGRHVMANKIGIAHQPLALSSVCEILGLLSASGSIALIGSILFGLEENYLSKQFFYGLLLSIVLVYLFTPGLKKVMIKVIPISSRIIHDGKLHHAFILAYLEYLLFFVTAGSILLLLVYSIQGHFDSTYAFAIIATFAVSWLAGFITPGAPSGIGIRETIMVVTLDKLLLTQDGILIAILFRLVTISGDLLFFLFAGQSKIKEISNAN